MVIRGSDHTPNLDLRNRTTRTFRPDTRYRHIPLHQRQHILDRRMMRPGDQRLRPTIGHRP